MTTPLLLLLSGLAGAQPTEPDAEAGPGRPADSAPIEDGPPARVAPATATDDDLASSSIVVYAPDGTPRVAGSAHVIDEDELETWAYDDIGRVLSQTPGVYVRGEDGFGLRPNIGMRGASSERSSKVTLLEDGVPLVPAPYAAPAAYYFPMPTRLAGIEVFKGPAATQHGPQTVGGAINLLTRSVPQAPLASVDLAYGPRNTARLHAYGGTGNERAGVLAEVAHLRTDGFKQLDGGGPTGFARTDVMLKGRLASDPALATRHTVELKLGWGSERSDETYLGLHRDDYAANPDRRYVASALDRMVWQRTQAQLSHRLERRDLKLRTVAYHHYLDRSWNKFNRFAGGPDTHLLMQRPEAGASAIWLALLRGEESSATPGQRLQIGDNDRQFHALGVQSTARWTHWLGSVRGTLEAGVRVHHDIVFREHSEVPYAMEGGALRVDGERQVLLDSISTATGISAHLHEDLDLGKLHVLPGLRSETVRTTARAADSTDKSPALRTTLLPGLGVLLDTSWNSHVFAGVYRGFSPVAPGQPAEVRPESSVNAEAGFRAGGERANAEVVGFFNRYTNLTGQCTFAGGCLDDQLDRQFNGGLVWVYGAEATARAQLMLPGRIRVPLSASYTLTQSQFRTGFSSPFPLFGNVSVGDALPYVPVHQGGARVGLEHPWFSIHAGLNGRSGMRDSAGQGELTADDVPALLLVDLAASVQLSQRFAVYTTLVNAANSRVMESWRPYGARPTAPRQLMVGVTFDAGGG